MSTHTLGMGTPGYTLEAGTSADVAGPIIAHTFVAEGFRYKSAPGSFPIKLAYSTVAASLCIEWFSGIVPMFLVPTFLRKMLPLKVQIRVLGRGPESSTLRIDMDSLNSTVLVFPFFDRALHRGLTALTEKGLPVQMGPLTDSALEKRNRNTNR